MHSLPEVTIAIPCFNGEAFLKEAIASVLRQKGTELEVLVIDDGSEHREKIKTICDSFNDARVFYHFQPNEGVSSALNKAIRMAKGKYFCWLSHDDLMSPNRLVRQVQLMKAVPPKAMIFGDFTIFGPDAQFPGRLRLKSASKGLTGIEQIANGHLNGCTIMIETDELKSLGFFDVSLRFTQDYDMWIRLVENNVKLIHCNFECCKSRQHPNQTAKISVDAKSELSSLWKRVSEKIQIQFEEDPPLLIARRLMRLLKFIEKSPYLAQISKSDLAPYVSSQIHGLISEKLVREITFREPTKIMAWFNSLLGILSSKVAYVSQIKLKFEKLSPSIIVISEQQDLNCKSESTILGNLVFRALANSTSRFNLPKFQFVDVFQFSEPRSTSSDDIKARLFKRLLTSKISKSTFPRLLLNMWRSCEALVPDSTESSISILGSRP